MITLSEVTAIHDILIERFGGSKGIRDMGTLESALGRPFQTFDNKELYPGPDDKAAAIFESLISNHSFVDGNKRTAYVWTRVITNSKNRLFVGDPPGKVYLFEGGVAVGATPTKAWMHFKIVQL